MNDTDDESSWRDDMIAEVVRDFVSRAVGAAAREEIELPHIVVCRDTETGAVSYAGPFHSGIDALVFADHESRVDVEVNDGAPMEFSVAALLPAHLTEAR